MPALQCVCGRPECTVCNPLFVSTGERDDRRALHFSEGKPGVDQIPSEVILEWGEVYTYGEEKYGRDNWKQGNDWHEFYGSVLRHMFAFWGGEDIDPESGMPHLVQALWNCGALRYFQLHGIGTDDRGLLSTPEDEMGEESALTDNKPNFEGNAFAKHTMMDNTWHYEKSSPDTCALCQVLVDQSKGDDDGQTEQRSQ